MYDIFNNPNDYWMKDYDDEDHDGWFRRGCLMTLIYVAFIIFALAVCSLFESCQTITKVIEVERVQHDTTYITKQQRDSIWLHDSIRVSEKGDTVRIEKWHTKYVERQVHDTLYKSKVDTVPVPYPVEKLVEKKLSKTEKGLMGTGVLTLMALVVFVAVKVKRFLP